MRKEIKKQIWGTIAGIIFILVLVRLALPFFVLGTLNRKLGKLEGPLCAHISDIDLFLLRGMYQAEGFTVSRWSVDRKKCNNMVLRMEQMRVSVSWSQLLKGRARLDVEGAGVDLFADDLMDALKQSSKNAESQAKAATEILVPWRVDSLRLEGGSVHLKLLGGGDSAVTLDQIEGLITGIEQGRQTSSPTLFRLKSKVFGDANFILTGALDQSTDPAQWDIDFEMENMDLTRANRFLLNRAPLSFTSGEMNLYGEASQDGSGVKGYTKLLFRQIDVVANREVFKNFKHGLNEIFGSLFFILAKDPKTKIAGTVVNFGTEKSEFKTDIAGILRSAFDHRSGKHTIENGIENRLSLPVKNKEMNYE